MAPDNRKSPRIDIDQPIQVIDATQNSVVGNLVNLSSSGLMVLTTHEVPISHVFQLEMHLYFSDNSEKQIKFGAESLWAQETSTPEHSWVGFHIIDISSEDFEVLNRMIDE
ncbi:MAG: PilZ domain-containing protein [Aestuariibacter sp.]|nr:PilZ domain-containing protein [Aestuariibacter sp.]